jgi:two-component system chemotaxis response regulator CheB
VVLTGMGNDGAAGVKALHRVGSTVWAEAQSSSVVFGMPEAAIATGGVKRVLALDELGPQLAKALSRKRD